MTPRSGTPSGQQHPEAAHHERTVRVLRLLRVAALALPALILAAGGVLAWRSVYQGASAETDRIVDLVYESTSKLFGAQLLALQQVRWTIGPLADDAVAAEEHALHDHLVEMLRFLPHLRDLYFVGRSGRSGVDAIRYPVPPGSMSPGGTISSISRTAARGCSSVPLANGWWTMPPSSPWRSAGPGWANRSTG